MENLLTIGGIGTIELAGLVPILVIGVALVLYRLNG